jgi:hypothetical protein
MRKVLKVVFSLGAVFALLFQLGVFVPTAEAQDCDCVDVLEWHTKPHNDGDFCYCDPQEQLVAVVTCKAAHNQVCNPIDCD